MGSDRVLLYINESSRLAVQADNQNSEIPKLGLTRGLTPLISLNLRAASNPVAISSSVDPRSRTAEIAKPIA